MLCPPFSPTTTKLLKVTPAFTFSPTPLGECYFRLSSHTATAAESFQIPAPPSVACGTYLCASSSSVTWGVTITAPGQRAVRRAPRLPGQELSRIPAEPEGAVSAGL